ncbi:hypothetical protein D3C78_1865980 [compost metagenome]
MAVALEVTDGLVNLVQASIEILAPPQQRADQQRQGQEQQWPLGQAIGQLTEARCPGQRVDLFF